MIVEQTIIEKYVHKWQEIILSTTAIDKKAAVEAINQAYAIIGYAQPTIIICDSLYDVFQAILDQGLCRLDSGIESYLIKKVWNQVKSQLNIETLRLIAHKNLQLKYQVKQYKSQIINQLRRQLHSQANQLQKKLLIRSRIYLQPEVLASYGSKSDFCISELNCEHDSVIWQAFQSIIQNCGWIISLEKFVSTGNREKVVIICPAP
jgi:hypothetical protein